MDVKENYFYLRAKKSTTAEPLNTAESAYNIQIVDIKSIAQEEWQCQPNEKESNETTRLTDKIDRSDSNEKESEKTQTTQKSSDEITTKKEPLVTMRRVRRKECKKCNKTFFTQRVLKVHPKKMCNSVTFEKKESQDIDKNACSLCKRRKAETNSKTYDKNEDEATRSYSRSIKKCPEAFLNLLFKQAKVNINNYKCPFCKKTENCEKNMLTHFMKFHSKF